MRNQAALVRFEIASNFATPLVNTALTTVSILQLPLQNALREPGRSLASATRECVYEDDRVDRLYHRFTARAMLVCVCVQAYSTSPAFQLIAIVLATMLLLRNAAQLLDEGVDEERLVRRANGGKHDQIRR